MTDIQPDTITTADTAGLGTCACAPTTVEEAPTAAVEAGVTGTGGAPAPVAMAVSAVVIVSGCISVMLSFRYFVLVYQSSQSVEPLSSARRIARW